jgi:anti-sigma factor RsiW
MTSELIPWYLNGSLSGEERDEVEVYLRQSAVAVADLALWRAVQLHTRAQTLADAGTDLGWRRLRGRLRTADTGAGQNWWKAAVAAGVLAIAGLQTVILLRPDSPAVHRPLTGASAPATQAWRFQVRFQESANIKQINELLHRLDASLVAGPSALGIYELAIERGTTYPDAQALLEVLQREPLILQVTAAP